MPIYQQRKEIFRRQCVLFFCALLSAYILAACSNSEPVKKDAQAPASPLVLEVKQNPYTFSMFPEYQDDKKSKLKLDIRDNKDKFIRASKITAILTAKDGHRQLATFVEDPSLETYIAEIPLQHHEEYLVQTELVLPAPPGRFTPVFSFHCCDPVAPVLHENVQPPEGDATK